MVLSLIEHDEEGPLETSIEMLTLARELADELGEPVEGVVFGTATDELTDTLGSYGVETIHQISIEQLDSYAPDAWAEALSELLTDVDPDAVIAPGSDRGQEVLARLGAMLDLPMAANCVEVTPGEPYELTRHRWGGSLLEQARLGAETKLLTIAEHEVPMEPADSETDPAINDIELTVDDEHTQVRVERIEEADIEGVPLGEARVVVGGGRGVGNADDYDILEELADLLGGTVGASRAAVNEGWRPHDDQIGLTGTKISPDIYIACGISGAVQHMVGCKGAKNILAINTDPEAAIIGKAEYAVIGDLHEVVPRINELIRNEVD